MHEPSDGDGESANLEARSAVDQAGIRRVLEFERSQGRVPKEMPAKHPGYDIESSDANGRIVRYIEVKSLRGAWDMQGAGLTRTQFEKGAELSSRYWLYVVEYAVTDGFMVHRIQNPVVQVNQFLYDDGCKALGESAMDNEPGRRTPQAE